MHWEGDIISLALEYAPSVRSRETTGETPVGWEVLCEGAMVVRDGEPRASSCQRLQGTEGE